MNILHIVSAKVWGGGEQYAYNVCREQKLRGHKIFVVIDDGREILKCFDEVGTVLEVNLATFRAFTAESIIAKFIKENNIQIVNIHSGRIGLLGLLLKRKLEDENLKIVMYRHNLTPNKKDLYHKYLRSKIDAFICVSKAVYDLQKQTIEKGQEDKVKLVYNGINLDRFPDLKVEKNPDEFVIGYAGRFSEIKGLLVLIDAMAELKDKRPNFRAKIVGQSEGQFIDTMLARIKEKNVEDIITIDKYTYDINRYYRSFDLYTLPSRNEAFGLVIIEAMACGIPVITTNSGAQQEIITNGKDGIIISPNKDELAKAIEKLYNDKKLYQKIAEEGLETVNNRFTIKTCVDGIHRVYDSLYK